MDNLENRTDLTPDEAAFVHLIERALIEGSIRQDRLHSALQRLNASPEAAQNICRQLQQEQIRLISGVEDPQYSPEVRSSICRLLDDTQSPLTERERLVLTLRLRESKSAAEVAQRMGVSRERIVQVERKALRLLRRRKKTGIFPNDPLPKGGKQDIVYPNTKTKKS